MARKHKLDPRSPFAALQPLKQQMEAEAAAAEGSADKAPGAKAPPEAPRKPAQPAVEAWRPNRDQELFRAAMYGVRPLAEAPARVTSAPQGEPRPRRDPMAAQMRKAQAEGGPVHTVQWAADGTVRAWRKGHEFALEVLDRFAAPADTLDLHGCAPHEAALRVVEFVRSRRARQMRCVRVVCGWGRGSPDGVSVLCDAVVKVLSGPPATAVVDAFASAPDTLGGRGALLVSLRA